MLISASETKYNRYEALAAPPGNAALQVSHCFSFPYRTLDFFRSSCTLLNILPVIALIPQAANWTMTAETLSEVRMRIGSDRDIVDACGQACEARRLMDEFEVVSGPSRGTVATAGKRLQSRMFL